MVLFLKGPTAAKLRIAVPVQLAGEALEVRGSDSAKQSWQLGLKGTRKCYREVVGVWILLGVRADEICWPTGYG